MGLFSTDWVKKAEELKKAWLRAQQIHNFAPPGLRIQTLQALNAAKKAYDDALGRALKQQAQERKKSRKKK